MVDLGKIRVNFLFSFAFFLATSSTSFAQIISFGYRAHFGGMEAYKDVIQFYNDNRPWLDNKLSSSRYMNGFEIGFGGSREKYGYTLGRFFYQFSNARAIGSSNGISFERSIHARMFGVELVDVWYTPIEVRGFNFGIGIMPLGLGFFRIHTKLNGEKKKISLTDFSTGILSSSHNYVNLHFDITKVTEQNHSLQFQLFYSIGPKQEYELLYLNQEINPATYSQIRRRTLMKINNWGMKLMYSI